MPESAKTTLKIKLIGNTNGKGNKGRVNNRNSKLNHSKSYNLTPVYMIKDDIIEYVELLSEFCIKYDLQRTNLASVIKGKRKSHKGWKLYEH